MTDQQTPQKSRWRTVKVFISSTFRDMYAERDHLVKVVFPALREKLGKYRVYLIDIDLRWGVTKEHADNDQVLDLCLQQIEEWHILFISLLAFVGRMVFRAKTCLTKDRYNYTMKYDIYQSMTI